MIFIRTVETSIYSNRTVTVKWCLASFNFYAIAYLAFSYGYWSIHVHNISLAVAAISTGSIAV